jgi:hypothetical protein
LEILKDIYSKVVINKEVEINVDISKLYTDETLEEDIYYIINNFFKIEKEKGIDLNFCFEIARNYSKYKDEVKEKVDNLAKTFKFREMDIIDRTIFLL